MLSMELDLRIVIQKIITHPVTEGMNPAYQPSLSTPKPGLQLVGSLGRLLNLGCWPVGFLGHLLNLSAS